MARKKRQSSNQEEIVPLKVLREQLDLSQLEFAVALGVDPGTVSRCERGLSELTLTLFQVKLLCRLTGKSLEDLPDYLGKPQQLSKIQCLITNNNKTGA
jgi:transcriptional regulator with XRE-family HTH domain